MRCVICGRTIAHSDHCIPTTTGEQAHLSCAERDAEAAWKSRQRWALLHAVTAGGITLAIAHSYANACWQVALALASSHALLHRRWWYFAVKDVRRLVFRSR